MRVGGERGKNGGKWRLPRVHIFGCGGRPDRQREFSERTSRSDRIFPAEPAIAPLTYSLVPGHLGEAWMGATPALVVLYGDEGSTDVQQQSGPQKQRVWFPAGSRNQPRGSQRGDRFHCLPAGRRDHARVVPGGNGNGSPIPVMLQLGQQSGQMFGLYMSSVIPQVPQFDDSDKRQQWQFVNCRAQGVLNDEIFVAFG